MIIVPGLIIGLHLDHTFQLISLALLLAGGITGLQVTISRTLNRKVAFEAWADFFLWVVGLAMFLLCRFYIFPQQVYIFFGKDEWEWLFVGNMKYVCYGSPITMMIFNVAIFVDGVIGIVSRFNIALNCTEKNYRRMHVHAD